MIRSGFPIKKDPSGCRGGCGVCVECGVDQREGQQVGRADGKLQQGPGRDDVGVDVPVTDPHPLNA